MSDLLVSVQSAREVEPALAGGASWIDVKQPSAGSLGAPCPETVREVVREIAGRVPVSVAWGELSDCDDEARERRVPVAGVCLYKLGLSATGAVDWRSGLREIGLSLASGVDGSPGLAAVAYADSEAAGAPTPEQVLEFAIAERSPALLVDTWDKAAGRLFDAISHRSLAEFVARARAGRVPTLAIAGSLGLEDVASVVELNADLVAVRGAATTGSRTAAIDAARVSEFRRAIDAARWRPTQSMRGSG